MKHSVRRLALAELRTLASLLQAVLLALDHTRVAREEASLLELLAIVASLKQSTGDAVAQSASLTRDAAAVEACDDVEMALSVGDLERRHEVVD